MYLLDTNILSESSQETATQEPSSCDPSDSLYSLNLPSVTEPWWPTESHPSPRIAGALLTDLESYHSRVEQERADMVDSALSH